MGRSVSGRKHQEWQRRFKRFQKSRQTVTAFCQQEGVSTPSFYLWRKRLRQSPVTPRADAELMSGFRPVRIVPAAGVSVQLPGGTQLVVPAADPESMRLVIETLGRVDAESRGGAGQC